MGEKRKPSSKKIQREIRAQQKFSVAGAIGHAGSGLMKGESPVSQQEQTIILMTQSIDQHTSDPSGALKSLLRRRVRDNELMVARHLGQPDEALRELINAILANNYALHEFVRQVDVRWGELYQERPKFQMTTARAANPDDEYTHESVRHDLIQLLEKIS
jgi:hypothetical protein